MTPHPRAVRRLLGAVAALGLGLAMALALGEGLARLAAWWDPTVQALAAPSSSRPPRAYPTLEAYLAAQSIHAVPHRNWLNYWSNALGLNDEEFVVPKPAGRFRIMAVGDSFTFGVVPYPDAVMTVLEARLRALCPAVDLEVLNFGVGGMGVEDYRAVVSLSVARFAPDLVVVHFYAGNDGPDLYRLVHERTRWRSLLGHSQLWTLTTNVLRVRRAVNEGVRAVGHRSSEPRPGGPPPRGGAQVDPRFPLPADHPAVTGPVFDPKAYDNETLAELFDREGPSGAVRWLEEEIGLSESAAQQLVEYLAAAKAALGVLPSTKRVIFERFFDETGDTHLVVHSAFGSRINRAWGLSLRKRFCRRFNFELQAAALEDSIVLSLGAVHSFALEEVVRYLSSKTVRDLLTQAVLDAPLFGVYWRWNASTALAVRRFRNGKKQPAQFQRMDAEDLLSTVFPDQLACAENLAAGDREIPDHPLVKQTLDDCLTLNMDIDGLVRLLERIESGDVEVICRELTSPSPLAQEILGAKPYAFLDDAPAEERRTLAVQSRRYLSPEQAAELGQLDPGAIDSVRAEAWPNVLTPDELHDALALLGFVTAEEGAPWRPFFERLHADRRATEATLPNGTTVWVCAERLPDLLAALPGTVPADALALLDSVVAELDAETALRELVRSRLEALGPVTAETLARPFGLRAADMAIPLAALEGQGTAMRGRYTPGASARSEEEWCERRLLARIHRYTLKRLRNEIEPATLADYQRFLLHWQGLGGERRQGREALSAVLGELQGLALPAALWEREVLPARTADYGATLLDSLCTAGEVVWWRPRPSGAPPGGRASTVATSPIAIVPRGTLPLWRSLGSFEPVLGMSGAGERVVQALRERGALFFVEIVQASGLLRVQVEEALGELVARGVVTADSFTGLRAVLTPQSRRRGFRGRGLRRGGQGFDAAGRWALLPPRTAPRTATDTRSARARREDSIAPLRRRLPPSRGARAAEPKLARAITVLPHGRGARRDSGRALHRAVRRRAVRAHRSRRRIAAAAPRARRRRLGRARGCRSRVSPRHHGRRSARARAEPPPRILERHGGCRARGQRGHRMARRAHAGPATARREPLCRARRRVAAAPHGRLAALAEPT